MMNTAPSATGFKVVPDQSELDRVERDLRFHPAGVAAPAVLSLAALADFNRDGYLKDCASDVTAGLGWNAKGVMVNGGNPRGHWANPSRPAG
jgi:hypothetical protein